MMLNRPLLHFTPPADWMNDPNGLVYFENEWHLFYQWQPVGSDDKHWGHAVSPDLTHWEHLPPALFPDELGAIWSGSCVVDRNDTSGFFDGGPGLVALFTHHRQTSNGQSQSQSLAYSRDRGRTWTKYEGNPVIVSDKKDFRDPKAFWHEPTQSWIMVVAAGHEAEIYRSPDLKHWQQASAFGEGRMPNAIWECPDLFSLRDENGGNIWVLLSSFLDNANLDGPFTGCYAAYFAGDFDGYQFTPHPEHSRGPGKRLSFGPDDYAPVTFADAPEGRRILLGWLNHWGYAGEIGTAPWVGQMTLPRELRWQRGAISQSLPPELEAARFWPRLTLPALTDLGIELSLTAPLWELTLPASEQSWTLEAYQGESLMFRLTRNAAQNVWTMQRGIGSLPPQPEGKPGRDAFFLAPFAAPLLPEHSAFAPRLILDTCSVEAFCDERTVFCFQLFSSRSAWRLHWTKTE